MTANGNPEKQTPEAEVSLPRPLTLVTAGLLAAVLVLFGTLGVLSIALPDRNGETLTFPAGDLQFAFGSGVEAGSLVRVNQFENGYALISSGPVSFQAGDHRILRYTWLPSRILQEAAFFWRRAIEPENVSRTDITAPGTQLIDLSTETEWSGEITEIGFLVAGDNAEPVAIGTTALIPDSLGIRLQLTWNAWTSFEERSQQTINFLYGGGYRQLVALPVLVAAWLVFTLLFIWIFQRFGTRMGARQLLITAGSLFLFAWLLLDLRWAADNIRQVQLSLETRWHADEQQRLGSDLDGEIYQYVQRLKLSVLGNQNARILIVGDENAIAYYLLRAKYHLLPHSVNVAEGFAKELAPGSLDFVMFFGDPANLTKVPGWNPAWQRSLIKVDSGQWGAVFRIRKL